MLALFVIPVLIVIGLVRKHGNARPNLQHRQVGMTKLVLDKWQAQEFVSLTNGVDVTNLVGAFRFDVNEPMESAQERVLVEAIVKFIDCYATGSFEAYARFRFPVKPVISEDLATVMLQKLSIPQATITDKPEVAYRAWWDTFIKDSYKGFWIGLNLTNCEIHVEKSLSPTNDWQYTLTSASPSLTPGSIANVQTLVKNLSSSSPLSLYLRAKLSTSTSNLVFTFPFTQTNDWTQPELALLQDLNNIIQTNIYDGKRFAGITVSDGNLKLLAKNPRGPDLVRLNRLLLADAFPYAIKKTAWVGSVGLQYIQPSVTLHPSREEVYNIDGFVTDARIRVLPQLRGNWASAPIYLFLYWSPHDKIWLPERLVEMSSLGARTTGLLPLF